MGTAQEIVVSAEENGVATGHPEPAGKRNAVSLAMWRRLAETFAELGGRNDVRVVILTGAGGNFCAGADISEFSTVRADSRSGRIYEAANKSATIAVRDCRKPTIAAISGYGMGGGCALALACDLRVGDATTRMGIPAARLGVVYGELDCALLQRQVGLGNAKRVLYSGRAFDVERLRRHGAGRHRRPGHRARRARMRWPPRWRATRRCRWPAPRSCWRRWPPARPPARHAEIAAVIEGSMNSEDYREGARAFLEKRKPAFTGR